MVQFRKAERKKAKMRLGIAGPAGSGKTLSALLVAYGLVGDWEKIGLVDTERGSGELYAESEKAGVKIGSYQVLTLTPPYAPEKYVEAIRAAEAAGLEALVIDSLSHAWAGEGGLLEQHDKVVAASKSSNSWTAWREVTPKHNALVDAMLGAGLHVIATMRSKTEYVQAKAPDGSTVIKKVGAAPVQRDGMEYEFTVFLDISTEHVAAATKDRTGLLDGQYFIPTVDTGRLLKDWLESGAEPGPAAGAAAPGVADAGRAEGQARRQAQEPVPEAAGAAAGVWTDSRAGGRAEAGGSSRFGGGTCTACGKQVTGSGAAYSTKVFGRVLCPACQRAAAKEAAR